MAILEEPDEVRARLLREAEDAYARRVGSMNSISSADAALRDLAFKQRKIWGMSDQQLFERAQFEEEDKIDPPRPRF